MHIRKVECRCRDSGSIKRVGCVRANAQRPCKTGVIDTSTEAHTFSIILTHSFGSCGQCISVGER
jgi:hypothetical protein